MTGRLNRFDLYWVADQLGIRDPEGTFGGLPYRRVVDWVAFYGVKHELMNRKG